MIDDRLDMLVDNATHAVNNLIPDRLLNMLTVAGRSNLLFRINDALSPILRDIIDTADDDIEGRTQPGTIAAVLCELLVTHTAKRDEGGDHPEDRRSHVISEVHGTAANIDRILSSEGETGTHIYLVLDDGTSFRIIVDPVPS